MKKNKFLKIAGAIFTMCLMTTCAIGTTFAKYTTQSSASDTARVAKWGVEVSTSGTMFGKYYKDVIIDENDDTMTVESSETVNNIANVVAPGTKNDTGIEISIKGQPEVDYTIKAEKTQNASDIFLKQGNYGVMIAAPGVNAATNFTAEKIYYFNGTNYVPATLTSYLADPTSTKYFRLTDEATVADAFYYPIAWTASVSVDGTTYTQSPAFATLDDAFDALIGGINDYDGTTTTDYAQFDANTAINLVYKLTWAWAFDVDEASDAADTILGNLMAKTMGQTVNVVKLVTGSTSYTAVENTDYNLTVGCGFKVTATQVD